MYTFSTKAEVTQISLTGSRLIVILGALMTAPRSIPELNSLLTDCGLVDKNYSTDTIRIVLSTLKALGCTLTRPCKSNGFKYELISHPFAMTISDEEIQSLKNIYTNMTKDGDYRIAWAFDSFINTLCKHIFDENTINKLLSITSFRKIDKTVFEQIKSEDGKHNMLEIIYANPSNTLKKHDIVLGAIFLKNNKLYLKGLDCGTGSEIVLNIARIRSVLSSKPSKTDYKLKFCKMKYLLANFEHRCLPAAHRIFDIQDNKAVIEAEFADKFFAVQYALSLGCDCTVIEPEEVKEEVIDKLWELRKIYE